MAAADSPALVVAGVSARALAESAQQGGWRVIALDLFGDRDTRRASQRWLPIGEPATLAIDPLRLRVALAALDGEPGMTGWVAGGGFEGVPALLDAGGPRLPLCGMDGASVAALRDARRFFATLDRLGLAHPTVAFDAPGDPHGWLAKRAGGCGGWHIREAGDAGPVHPDTYYQRIQPGEPMSALFLADGRRATLIALNRLLVQRQGSHPHVFGGAIGPIADAALQARIAHVLDALVPPFGLRGLASLDFIEARGQPWLLEINPRPSASMVLHPDAWPEGLLRAHVQAMQGRLPAAPAQHRPGVRGSRIVFAPRGCRMDLVLAERLAGSTHCHDLPVGAAHFVRGEPVCSVSAEAADAHAVEQLLARRAARIASELVS
ncbi:ATP-grasp domain-containing protein [Piscinibacter sp. XHJ-5]|uniref:ATP-grasp domain-containing protein n=1 Tax=Piscinibacter sp. XHJ-5 TaxID=3037797 RepID=UPI00245341B0|nr:ATP-grasp domain-containing protein [Piscinibacter sp. XHJ-5]